MPNDTVLINEALHDKFYAQILHILQTYQLRPGHNIAIVSGISPRAETGNYGTTKDTLTDITIFMPESIKSVWIQESHFESGPVKALLRSCAIGDLVEYYYADEYGYRIARNFSHEERIHAMTIAYQDAKKALFANTNNGNSK